MGSPGCAVSGRCLLPPLLSTLLAFSKSGKISTPSNTPHPRFFFFFSPSSPPASFLGASECCVKLSEEFICGFLSFFFLSSCTCVVESNALDAERTQPLQSQHSLFCVFVLFPSRLMPVVSEKGCLHSVVKFAIDVPMKRGQGSSHWLDNTINCSSCFIWSL